MGLNVFVMVPALCGLFVIKMHMFILLFCQFLYRFLFFLS